MISYGNEKLPLSFPGEISQNSRQLFSYGLEAANSTWNPEALPRCKGLLGLALAFLHQPHLIVNYLSQLTEVFLLFLLSITGQSLLYSLLLTQHGIFSSVFKLLRNSQCQSLRYRYKKIFLAPSHSFPRSLNCFCTQLCIFNRSFLRSCVTFKLKPNSIEGRKSELLCVYDFIIYNLLCSMKGWV